MPLNPNGRTGLAGRGALPRWGPNHIETAVVSRWARGRKGNVSRKNNSPVVEVLLIRHDTGQVTTALPIQTDNTRQWSLPMSPVQGDKPRMVELRDSVQRFADQQEREEFARKALHVMFSSSHVHELTWHLETGSGPAKYRQRVFQGHYCRPQKHRQCLVCQQ